MSITNSYKELLELIRIHEEFIEVYERNKRLICAYEIKKNSPAGYREGTSYVDADTIHGGKSELHEKEWNKLTEEIHKLQSLIELKKELLLGYKEAKENIDKKLKGLDGIEYKIVYLRFVEGYTLQQIASELGYSYNHIKRISMQCNQHATDN